MNKNLLLALSLMIALPAHAGFMDALNAVGQVAGAMQQNNQAPQQANANVSASAEINTTPLEAYELEGMSCAQLEITAMRSQRQLDMAKSNLKSLVEMSKSPEYQQQKSQGAMLGMVGSLVANNGGKNAQYGQMAQQMGSNASSVDTQIDQQVELVNKYVSDLESIAVYQRQHSCKR
jgi:hypothetical protein